MRLIDWMHIKACLPPRLKEAHKGLYGHVLVVGGDKGMAGAARLAAEAALRVGAGIVSVATHPEHLAVINQGRPEILCYGLSSATELKPLIQKASVLVVGPGLGQSEWSKMLLHECLFSNLPKILDADALNLISLTPTRFLPEAIMTPHPGEAARLLGISVESIQKDRLSAVHELYSKYQAVIVLKGEGTLVQTTQGVARCNAGNPGMASAGMGDVLAGVIGGLLAQALSPTEAAEVGVYLHAHAADRVAKREGERGLLAADLMQELHHLVNPELIAAHSHEI